MHEARYFLPDHPQLRDVYSREELRAMLLSGRLKRSDIIVDDLTGHGHLLGDFLTWPDVKPFVEDSEDPEDSDVFPSSTSPPKPAAIPAREPQPAPVLRPLPAAIAPAKPSVLPPPLPGAPPPAYVEFRATTPLTTLRHSPPEEEEDPHFHHPFNADEKDEEDEHEEDVEDDEPDAFDDEDFDEEDFDYFENKDHPRLQPRRHAPLTAAHLRRAQTHADDDEGDPRLPAQPEPRLGAIEPADAQEGEAEDQEYLLHHFHPSWLSYRKALFAMLICGALGYLSYRAKMNMAYPFTAGSFFILCFLNTWLDRSSIDYYITTRRVEAEVGLIGRNSDEIRISDIRAMDVQMKGLSGLIGIGSINFSSGGGPLLDVHFKNVRNPHKIKRIVRELLG